MKWFFFVVVAKIFRSVIFTNEWAYIDKNTWHQLSADFKCLEPGTVFFKSDGIQHEWKAC